VNNKASQIENKDEIISITGSCTKNDGSVIILFKYLPILSEELIISYTESRGGSWNGAADAIISQLVRLGVKRGQVVSIDAHNNSADGEAIFSAHYCKDLPDSGPLEIT